MLVESGTRLPSTIGAATRSSPRRARLPAPAGPEPSRRCVGELREALLSHFRYEEDRLPALRAGERPRGHRGCARRRRHAWHAVDLGTISPRPSRSATRPSSPRCRPPSTRTRRRGKPHVPGVRAPAANRRHGPDDHRRVHRLRRLQAGVPNEAIAAGEPYVIDALRCTECVGAEDEPQCKLVCPVANCIVPNPDFARRATSCSRNTARCTPDRGRHLLPPPRMTPERFQDHWRTRHAELIVRLPGSGATYRTSRSRRIAPGRHRRVLVRRHLAMKASPTAPVRRGARHEPNFLEREAMASIITEERMIKDGPASGAKAIAWARRGGKVSCGGVLRGMV